jgi:hypothetical protein
MNARYSFRLDQFPDRAVCSQELEWRSFGVHEFEPSDMPAIHDSDDFCRSANSADHPFEYLPY